MSEEEKNAIAEVKDVIEYDKEHRIVTIYDKQPLFRDTLQIILNLIEKQQKEIEELKEKNSHITKETVDFVNSHYISKDKIKAKIEEINNKLKNADEIEAVFIIKQQQVLQSLLEKE